MKQVCCSVLLLFLLACSKTSDADNTELSSEQLQEIIQKTHGIISKGSSVVVVFKHKVVLNTVIGQSLRTEVFEFDEAISGETKWINQNTLAFTPAKSVERNKIYKGTLNLEKLFPSKSFSNPYIALEFSIVGNIIVSKEIDIKPVSITDPRRIQLFGMINFDQAVDFNKIKLINKFSNGVRINWKQESSSKFSFKSSPFKREKEETTVYINFDKKDFDLINDQKLSYFVPKMSELNIDFVRRKTSSTDKQIVVKFSDKIAKEKDWSGFLRVKPFIETKMTFIGKEAHISANFEVGKSYSVTIKRGIRSIWGTTLAKDKDYSISFSDLKPKVLFSQKGVYLPSTAGNRVAIRSVNVKKVWIRVEHVFQNNLNYFLIQNKLDGKKNLQARSDDDYYYNTTSLDYLGEQISQKEVLINSKKNEWVQTEIDLSSLSTKYKQGLYIIKVSFTKNDVTYSSYGNYEDSDSYNEDPDNYSYYYKYGNPKKFLLISDLAITATKSRSELLTQVFNVLTTEVESDVTVDLISKNNQIIASGKSDGEGFVCFNLTDLKKKKIQLIQASKGRSKTSISPQETKWDNSIFLTNGVRQEIKGIRSFIYTDRGVYRPGDSIYVSIISRNQNESFPSDHPLRLEFKNPRGQKESAFTLKKATDGFYSTVLHTDLNAITGEWKLYVKAGSKKFVKGIKVETIVPNRFKVKLKLSDEKLLKPKKVDLFLGAKYLFGLAASKAKYKIESRIETASASFPNYPAFSFTNASSYFNPVEKELSKGELNKKGEVKVSTELQNFSKVNRKLRWKIKSTVYEKGGRFTKAINYYTIHPYRYYVGVKIPQIRWFASGNDVTFPVLTVDQNGTASPNRNLEVIVYRNERYWWWEYSRKRSKRRFKMDKNTVEVERFHVKSKGSPKDVTINLKNSGEHLIEIVDKESGHRAGFFLSAYSWGDEQTTRSASTIEVKTDKDRYKKFDVAKLIVPSPPKGKILYRLLKGDELFLSKYIPVSGKEETILNIPIEEWMNPNIYVAISVVQSFEQTINDRPARMYSIVPLIVDDPSTKMSLEIDAPKEIKPKTNFSVKIKAEANSQVTLAIVDEGLLDLTNFSTPNPWKAFNKKQMLQVESFDSYPLMMTKLWGDVYQSVKIGGGLSEAERSSKEKDPSSLKTRRFLPVSMFKGPVRLNAKGEAEIKFKMPEYNGSVRIMAVAAKKNHYASSSKIMKVKSDLIVMPSLPRVLGPRDKFTLPVSVMSVGKGIKNVELKLSVEGPLSIIGEKVKNIHFSKEKELHTSFEVQVAAAIGKAKITILANSEKGSVSVVRNLDVRASNPRITMLKEKLIKTKQSVSYKILSKGIRGTNESKIKISKIPNMNIDHRISYLIRYPYGCIEQTTSSVFPQLFLSRLTTLNSNMKAKIDKNINAGIARLAKFHLSSGAFSYWPGDRSPSFWGTNYAGHFLIEAEALGYHVPGYLLYDWRNFQRRTAQGDIKNMSDHLYRIYTMALADHSLYSTMNYLKESKLASLSTTQKWLLAGAYYISGDKAVAEEIVKGLGTRVKDYSEFSGTYGSALRDESIILSIMTKMNKTDEALALFRSIIERLSGKNWYSTQTTAFSLLAVSQYLKENQSDGKELAGKIIINNKKEVPFKTNNLFFVHDLTEQKDYSIKIQLDSEGSAFSSVSWSGVPLREGVENYSSGIQLSVDWYNEDGAKIKPTVMRQGESFYAVYNVKRNYSSSIDEVVLTQLLPSAWEIENLRLNKESLPSWVQGFAFGNEEYFDIRDDRVSWFFDLDRNFTYRFAVKLNVVSVGDFFLPPSKVSAMYNDNYKAYIKGQNIQVKARK